MFKKTVSIMMAIVMSLGVFTGCGSSENSPASSVQSSVEEEKFSETQQQTTDEEVKLTVFWWGNQIRNERTQQVLDMYAEENPGVTFDGQFADGSSYWTRLATLAAGRTLPDVIQMIDSRFGQHVDNDLLVDLTPYIENGTIDLSNVSENIANAAKIDDGIYGICIGVNSQAMFYNKTLLDEAGIVIKDNMTLDEFKNICREVYEKTGCKTSLDYGSRSGLISIFLRGQGKHLYVDGKFGVDNAEGFEQYFSLYEEGREEGWLIDPSVYVEREGASVEQDCLVYGSDVENMSWCAFYASNQLVAMQDAAPEGVEIGITSVPSDNPTLSNNLACSQYLAITADSKYPEEAAKLINYFTNSLECNYVLLGERGVPVSSIVADGIAEKMTETDKKVIDFINNVVTPNSSPKDELSPAAAGEVTALTFSLVEKVMYGEITAEDAAAQLYEEGTAILSAN